MKKLFLISIFITGAMMSQEKYPTQTPYGFEYVKESGGIQEYKMTTNNLTVLLKEDHSAPVATFMVTYNVGSRNEAIGYTGSTHLLEHLMFKGSRKFNTDKENSVFQLLQSLGSRMNATTWLDRTNYYETMPSEHLETAIEIEADRMRNAFIKEADRQAEMTVVRNEFERGQNNPFSVLDEHIWATAYLAHPYHHSTIGWKSDIENVSIERLKKFYDTFYWPNNATVTMVGDFEKEKALALVKKHFGRIPKSREEIPKVYTEEPKQEGQRRVLLKRAGQQGVVGVAHKTPSATHEDAPNFLVLSSILSSGKNSRFYKNITDKGLTTSVFIWDSLFRDPGLFAVYANLTPGTDHQKVEDLVMAEYEKIKEDGVTEEEVEKAKAQLIASMKFGQDGSFAVAGGLNEAIASGDWTLFTTYDEKLSGVTKETVKAVVEKYFLEDLSTIGHFIPKVSGEQQTKRGPSNATELAQMKKQYFSEEEESKGPLASQIEDSEPVKGVRLLTLKRGTGVVTLTGSFLGGDIFAPSENKRIPDVVVSMLDQGTTKSSKFEISNKIEKVGARLSFSNGKARVVFNGKFLSEDTALIVGLLSEQLQFPAFNEEDLAKTKKRMITAYKKSKESTRGNAINNMLKGFYSENHQNAPDNADESIKNVEKITTEDLKAYHEENYGKGSMVIVAVGDVDHASLSATIKKNFGEWKDSPLEEKKETQKGTKNAGKAYVTMQDKTSTDFLVGIPLGINRDHPDYRPLFVASYILGGNFSARLMQTVRVKEGLTYGIRSSMSGFGNDTDGYWYVGGTFSPDLLSKGESSTLREIKKWAQDGVTQKEVDTTKSTLTGSFKVGFDTTRGLAGGILSAVIDWEDLSYVDEMPNMINSVTLEQVNAAIKKYISIGDLYEVAAGSIDQEGNPLKQE
jgi:zinc protease